MPKQTFNGWEVTYNITSVTVNKDKSVASYPDQTNATACVNGLKAPAGWTLSFEVKQQNKKSPPELRVNGFGYPVIDKHPGHVDPGTKGWKYNVDLGTGSVNRMFVAPATTVLSSQKNNLTDKKISVDVAIACSVSIAKDTH
jgi:hypothetical protein